MCGPVISRPLAVVSSDDTHQEAHNVAIIMSMRWKGVTPAQYDQIRKLTNQDADPPAGCRYHAAGFDNDGIRVSDVWDSPEQFQHFVESRLMAATQQAGVGGQPEVEIIPLHAKMAPNP